MTKIPRQRPDPLPAIHPLPEYLAEGATKARYEDMKAVLQVPWMGVVTMAYAHYPSFFDTLWDGLRPLCLSASYVAASCDLRAFIEEAVGALDPPPIAARLEAAGYAPRELADIRAMIEVFSHGNFAYLPLAAAVSLLLAGETLRDDRAAPPFDGRHAPDVLVPFLLMEAHHADAPTQAVYDDVKATLGLPFVNTDYRALARWPSYFALAWGDLRSVAGTAPHEALCQAVHDRVLDAARALPNPGGLSADAVRVACERDASLAEVAAMNSLFLWLIPGLVTNVAFFRRQFETG